MCKRVYRKGRSYGKDGLVGMLWLGQLRPLLRSSMSSEGMLCTVAVIYGVIWQETNVSP